MTRKPMAIGERAWNRQLPLAVPRRTRISVLRLTLFGLLVFMLGGGLFTLGCWLLTADLFAIARVETGAYRYSCADPLEAHLAAALGRNLWSFGTGTLADSLRTLPWVKEVRMQRRLPATLRVEFREWCPLLEIVRQSEQARPTSGHLVLLENGQVVPFPADLPAPSLPLLVGADLEPTGEGMWQLTNSMGQGALDLVAALAETGLEAICPVDFIIAGQDGFTVVLQGRQGRLLVGSKDFSARLQRYIISRDRLAAGGDFDLRFRNRVFSEKTKKRA